MDFLKDDLRYVNTFILTFKESDKRVGAFHFVITTTIILIIRVIFHFSLFTFTFHFLLVVGVRGSVEPGTRGPLKGGHYHPEHHRYHHHCHHRYHFDQVTLALQSMIKLLGRMFGAKFWDNAVSNILSCVMRIPSIQSCG